ncbi:hypothetical protein OC844_007318, partial [Tilletia horrida]
QQAQQERLQEETKDARENGMFIDTLATLLLPFHAHFENKSVKELLELALLTPDDEASGGKLLAEVFGLSQSVQGRSQGAFLLALDERGARSLTDDAKEAPNVLAVHVEGVSLSWYLENEILQSGERSNTEIKSLLARPPADSSASRIKLLNFAHSCTSKSAARVWQSDDWDTEALNQIWLVRLMVLRAKLEAAALTMGAATLRDPLSMFAGLASDAQKDPGGVAHSYRY